MSAVDYLVALKTDLITNGIANPHKIPPIVNGAPIKNENKTINGVESKTINGTENGAENGTENGAAVWPEIKLVNGVKSK